ncbi:sensor histidine kinase [Jannaschia sp. W003]|uniref:sensor histidine kinase n=1 Tax=Jannaschia sp. W003 TaxID=2867012 RepID=UPI0021A2E83F|nr:HWE histidine kinase domain-containing protein [Jannaschia sp. W003]UWQ21186.1 hypothetical protein K3554_14610 [Jannaschia sp. W003]
MTTMETFGAGKQDALAQLVDEAEWVSLASTVGGMGRYVVDPAAGVCQLDTAMSSIIGTGPAGTLMPLEEALGNVAEADAPRVRAAIEEAVGAIGEPVRVEFQYDHPDGRTLSLDSHFRAVRAGERTLLVGLAHDVTDLRRARDTSEMLAREMAHRLKNVFALVQGMFNMAARGATDVAALSEGFRGRLQALAAVNALTFAGRERSVALSDLVDEVLGPLVEAGRVEVRIEPFALNGPAAQTVVLALNELMTNAVKHGALRDEGGTVRVEITVEGPDFVFRWHENATHPVEAPTGRGGFGMRVLQTMTVATFEGRPTFDWRPEGLRFECHWNAAEFSDVSLGKPGS